MWLWFDVNAANRIYIHICLNACWFFFWYSFLAKPELSGGDSSCCDEHWLDVHLAAQCCFAAQYRLYKKYIMFPRFPSCKHIGVEFIQ